MPRFKEISNDRIENYLSSIKSEINNRVFLNFNLFKIRLYWL